MLRLLTAGMWQEQQPLPLEVTPETVEVPVRASPARKFWWRKPKPKPKKIIPWEPDAPWTLR